MYSYSKRLIIDRNSIEHLLPAYCVLMTYKTIYNYFIFLIPSLQGLWVLLYNFAVLTGLVLFIPLALHVMTKNRRYRLLHPAIIIPLCVIINIIVVMFETGDVSMLSRQHILSLASGTNDARGYYFAQINTWFCNMSAVLMIAVFTKRFDTIKKCLLSAMATLFIPAILMVVIHPEYIGMRQSIVEGSNVVFGGGLWNIGVIGIGSLSWLGLAFLEDMTKRQRRFVIIAVALFAFLGIAGLSRTLILMLILSGCTYFLLAKKDSRLLTKILLISFMIVAFVLVEQGVVDALFSRINDTSTGGTHNIRFLLWGAYLSHFKEVWLAGAPYGSVYNYYHDVNLYGAYFLPHSSIVNFLVRFGLLCALSYLCLIKNAFFSSGKYDLSSINRKACLKAGGVAYISLAFINQTGYAESVFYVMFGLLLAYSQLVINEGTEVTA